MTIHIPVFRPKLIPYTACAKRFEQIDSERVYTNGGAQMTELVERIAQHFGVDSDQVVVGSSATMMLTGAAVVLGTGHWVLPSWTFTASALALTNAGCAIRFIDVDPNSHVAGVSELPKGSNVLMVAPWGKSLTIDPDYNHLHSLIVDAAASIAHPVQYSTDFNGLARTIEVYSLHATKVLGIGEGGFAIVRDKKLARTLKSWTNFGFGGERVSVNPGANAKLSEYSAAIGCETFLQAGTEFEEWRAVRRLAQKQESRLGLSSFYSCEAHVSPYWILRLPDGVSVEQVVSQLAASGVESRRWWGEGCHVMPFFDSVDRLGALDGTSKASRTSLGLPFSRDFSALEFEALGSALEEALGRS
jgi:dTDP-4-amino-4,6-dideoxygalactose transaminase